MKLIPSLTNAPIIQGTRVLVRADFNIPIHKGKIEDDFRIQASLPSFRFIIKKGGKLRIISHYGRPHGKKTASLSLQHVAACLRQLLKKEVIFIHDPLQVENIRRYNADARILFFENMRFWPGEEKNDAGFARTLAQWGDIYVNEAFAVSHRAHASIVALAHILPAYAGISFEKEIQLLQKIRLSSQKPVSVIIGGAKAKTKLPFFLASLKNGYDVLVGGVLANTIFWKNSVNVGTSRIDQGVKKMLKKISLDTPHLHLPKDAVVAEEKKEPRIALIGEIKSKEAISDIGPETVRYFGSIMKQAKTIIWNGPLGVAEMKEFSKGTIAVARVVRTIDALKIVGGGDSLAAFRKNNLLGAFTHVSTGGGAMLTLLSGEKLPGIEALRHSKFKV